MKIKYEFAIDINTLKYIPIWKADRNLHEFRCPDCNGEMVANKGNIREHYYSHSIGQNGCEGDSFPSKSYDSFDSLGTLAIKTEFQKMRRVIIRRHKLTHHQWKKPDVKILNDILPLATIPTIQDGTVQPPMIALLDDPVLLKTTIIGIVTDHSKVNDERYIKALIDSGYTNVFVVKHKVHNDGTIQITHIEPIVTDEHLEVGEYDKYNNIIREERKRLPRFLWVGKDHLSKWYSFKSNNKYGHVYRMKTTPDAFYYFMSNNREYFSEVR